MLRNELGFEARPLQYVQIAEGARGHLYFLDTARTDDRGECPVVSRDRTGAEEEVASDFLEFLSRRARHGHGRAEGPGERERHVSQGFGLAR